MQNTLNIEIAYNMKPRKFNSLAFTQFQLMSIYISINEETGIYRARQARPDSPEGVGDSLNSAIEDLENKVTGETKIRRDRTNLAYAVRNHARIA
jgi:hypothetical protein